MKFLCALCVLCGLGGQGFALDREAFTFTNYNLTVRLEPEQQRLAVRGRITLRNDSDIAQNNATLQVSSSLSWRSIKLAGKPLEFISQAYTSDIDHTGSLSEAIVTLSQPVPPKGVVELEIGYEGTISLNTARLARVGVPEEVAKHTDWDQITSEFTAVRGIGYVTWYPIATEAANLSAGDSVFDAIAKWKTRNADSTMDVTFESTLKRPIFFSGSPSGFVAAADEGITKIAVFHIVRMGINVPVFLMANYTTLPARDTSSISYLPGSEDVAKTYSEALAKLELPFLARVQPRLQVLQLADPDAAPFVSESVLLTPLVSPISTDAEMNAVYALARQAPNSQRAWIHDGVAHYALLHYIEQQGRRPAVLSYLGGRLPLLTATPKVTDPAAPLRSNTSEALINSSDDPKSQIKAMWVWWMLREMLGEESLTGSLLDYQATADKEPSYMQHLIEAQSKKDLQWFFDDWVYHGKGLPDFRVVSVYSSKNPKEGYLVTVVVENLGNAGAEVPVVVHYATGDATVRLEVPGKSKASVRVAIPTLPEQVTVNDGSVPESDMSNNLFKVEAAPDNR